MSKYFDSALALLASVGMEASEARTVARLANAYVAESGMADAGVDGAGVKSGKTKFAASLTGTTERKLAKGALLTEGEVAFKFLAHVYAWQKEWPATIGAAKLPTGLASAHLRFMEADAKRAAEKPANK